MIWVGRNASYISALAEVPAALQAAFVDIHGNAISVGSDARWSVQSISKVFALMALLRRTPDTVWRMVGRNPSGRPFNDRSLLETERKPRNPCINAGAVALSSLLAARGGLDELLLDLTVLGGRPAIIDEEVAEAEYADCEGNRAIARKLLANGVLAHDDVESVLRTYCRQCALHMDSEQVARCLLPLATGGWHDRLRWMSRHDVIATNAVMLAAGTYDNCGEVLWRVGAPAKSGVGGGLAAVFPGRGVVCAWSPRLDEFGNSVAAQDLLARFTELTGWSLLV